MTDARDREARRADAASLLIKTAVGGLVLLGGVAALGVWFRPPIERAARWAVSSGGIAGIGLGAFISDLFMLPIPPQFYMLLSIAAGAPQGPCVAAACAGSVAAACLAYPLASRAGHVGFVRARLNATRARIDPLFARWGYWAVAIGALSPIPFSWLCYFGGLYRIPLRYYSVFVVLRVPRLLFFYALMRAGWGLG